MSRLLTEVNVFSPEMVNAETEELMPNAKISEEFVYNDTHKENLIMKS